MPLRDLDKTPTFQRFLEERQSDDFTGPHRPDFGLHMESEFVFRRHGREITFPPGENGQGPGGRRSMVRAYWDYVEWCEDTDREPQGPEAVWV